MGAEINEIPFFFLLVCQYSRYQRLSFDRNILQNGSGELETEETVFLNGNRNEEDFDSSWFKSWNVLSSGGNGWRLFPLSQTGYYFATSFHSCSKEQIICLAENGVSPRMMDCYQPDIEVEEYYSKHLHHGASYELNVILLNESGNVVGKSLTLRDDMTAEEDDQFRKVSNTWTDYGVGVRYVKFYHGGFAQTLEPGWHGAKMTGARVTLRYPHKKKAALPNTVHCS